MTAEGDQTGGAGQIRSSWRTPGPTSARASPGSAAGRQLPPGWSAGADGLAALGLTRREREVLGLVAEGLTNGQLDEALFTSTTTASVHVSNILSKQGVSTRTQAAAVAHRAEPRPPAPPIDRRSSGT